MTKALTVLTLAVLLLLPLALACGQGAEEPAPPATRAAAQPRSDRAATSAPAATAAPVSRSQPVTQVVEEEVESAADRAAAAPAASSGRAAPTTAPAATSAPSQAAAPAARTSAREAGGEGQPSATTFRDYGRLEFTEAALDNVSTFSLDTDRTSYHLALGWAKEGYEVDPLSVRAEEWINAFDYQYEMPQDGGSFSVTTNAFRHPLDGRLHMARIGLQAPIVLDATPLNVTLLLDASGSMREGNRVDIARAAAESIRDSLDGQDRLAIVHFTNNVKHNLTVEHREPGDPDVGRSIEQLQPGGSTNVQAGLNEAVWLADQARRDRPNAYNYIILMSDGVANVDATDPFAILRSSPDHDAQNPLRIITIGVGIENYNDVLLEQLAQHGNGWYRYLDDTDQAEATFSRANWLALSTPFADQARAQVTWDANAVRSWRIVGYENRITSDQSFTEERKEFAEMYAGAATTVFYELELWPEAQRARSADLGTVEVRWTDPATARPWRQHASITGEPDTDFGRINDPLVQLGAIVALSSDLYSGIPDFGHREFSYLQSDMYALLDHLNGLNRDLGRLQAYNDFHFVLEHISADVADMTPAAPSGTGSGYKP